MCERSGFNIKRVATEHAGGKWRLNYASVIQSGGNLEVDLSYLYRVILWPVSIKDSCQIGQYRTKQIPLLDIHELAAGKLAALMSRCASRDLYDVHRLLVDPVFRQKIDITHFYAPFLIVLLKMETTV